MMLEASIYALGRMSNVAVVIGYSVNKLFERFGRPILEAVDPKLVSSYREKLCGMTVMGYNIPSMVCPGLCITMNEIVRENGQAGSYALSLLD